MLKSTNKSYIYKLHSFSNSVDTIPPLMQPSEVCCCIFTNETLLSSIVTTVWNCGQSLSEKVTFTDNNIISHVELSPRSTAPISTDEFQKRHMNSIYLVSNFYPNNGYKAFWSVILLDNYSHLSSESYWGSPQHWDFFFWKQTGNQFQSIQ